jgi:Ca-activated chloride channel family protein
LLPLRGRRDALPPGETREKVNMKLLHWGWLLLALAGCPSTATTVVEEGDKQLAMAAPPEAPDLVDLEVGYARDHVRAGQPAQIVARVQIHGDVIGDGARPPVNLALVVDTSGSMQGDAIEQARKASLAVLDTLSDGDRLSVVSFDSEARVLCPSTVLDKTSRKTIAKAIGTMTAQGTTEMALGLDAGLNQVLSALNPSGINRVVLVGDGVPNEKEPLTPLATRAAQNNVPITTLGLGLDYDETVMGNVARISGGSFHFVSDPAAVAKVLEEEILELDQLVAQNLTVDLRPGPGVTITEVVGLPTTPIQRGVQVQVGELHEKETRDLIVKLSASGHAAGAVVELADVTVHYNDATVGATGLSDKAFLSVVASNDEALLAKEGDPDIVRATARAEVAGLVLQAIAAARAGNLPQANALVDQADKLARTQAKALGDDVLLERAEEMDALRKSLPTLATQPAATLVSPVPAVEPTTMIPPSPGAPPIPAAQVVRKAHEQAMRDLD